MLYQKTTPAKLKRGIFWDGQLKEWDVLDTKNGAKKVRKYTTLASQIKTGYNFTVSAPNTEISVEYLLRAVSAEGGTFITRHSINQPGVVSYHVSTTNNVTSLPIETSREVGVQKQVTFISADYPAGFDYYGTRKNIPVEFTLNVFFSYKRYSDFEKFIFK